MTRKDHELIAKVLREIASPLRDYVVTLFVNSLARDPKFDRAKFKLACGIPPTKPNLEDR